jgi:hypothetical protein
MVYLCYLGFAVKNTKKLEIINQKIADLANQKKELEAQMVQSVSKQVASVLIKKRVSNIDIPAFMKKIETVIDEMNAK